VSPSFHGPMPSRSGTWRRGKPRFHKLSQAIKKCRPYAGHYFYNLRPESQSGRKSKRDGTGKRDERENGTGLISPMG
jgi:hypothetical protein